MMDDDATRLGDVVRMRFYDTMVESCSDRVLLTLSSLHQVFSLFEIISNQAWSNMRTLAFLRVNARIEFRWEDIYVKVNVMISRSQHSATPPNIDSKPYNPSEHHVIYLHTFLRCHYPLITTTNTHLFSISPFSSFTSVPSTTS